MIFSYPEGATSLDEDEKEGLLISHITTRGELNEWEQRNIADAYIWLDRSRHKNILKEDFIKRLHKNMFGKVWKWAGEYRKSDKNIGVDWSQIQIRFRQLLDDTKYWIENDTYPSDEIATRFHHRLVQIHLFSNGNGRHARLMTDLLLERVLDKEPFSWGSDSLLDEVETRRNYILALREADQNKYQLLLGFVRS